MSFDQKYVCKQNQESADFNLDLTFKEQGRSNLTVACTEQICLKLATFTILLFANLFSLSLLFYPVFH